KYVLVGDLEEVIELYCEVLELCFFGYFDWVLFFYLFVFCFYFGWKIIIIFVWFIIFLYRK
ncbi:hypothetical protein ACKUEN_25415, partial [Escherichia coli]|uniref:hypothetical protein n=1 Tax=Escherichia coli TaxID=562 RepID=UPI00390C5396